MDPILIRIQKMMMLLVDLENRLDIRSPPNYNEENVENYIPTQFECRLMRDANGDGQM